MRLDYGTKLMKQLEELKVKYGFGVSGEKEALRLLKKEGLGLDDDKCYKLLDGFAKLKGSKKKLQFLPTMPPSEDSITEDNGWLSPVGKFFPCRYGQHMHIARWLRQGDMNPEYQLEVEGWVKVQRGGDSDFASFFSPKDLDTDLRGKHVTPTQRRLVRERCQLKGYRLPWWADDLWD